MSTNDDEDKAAETVRLVHDPELIARWANEFFRAMPGAAMPSSGAGIPAGAQQPMPMETPVVASMDPSALPHSGELGAYMGPAAPFVAPYGTSMTPYMNQSAPLLNQAAPLTGQATPYANTGTPSAAQMAQYASMGGPAGSQAAAYANPTQALGPAPMAPMNPSGPLPWLDPSEMIAYSGMGGGMPFGQQASMPNVAPSPAPAASAGSFGGMPGLPGPAVQGWPSGMSTGSMGAPGMPGGAMPTTGAMPSGASPFGPFVPMVVMPLEADLRTLLGSLGGATGNGPMMVGTSTPAWPGAPVAPAGGSFYFLDESNAAGLSAPAARAASTAPPTVPAQTGNTRYEMPDPTGSSSATRSATSQFDAVAIRRDFPILSETVNGHRLVWLDNAATTQKPRVVIDRLKHFYEHENSNIHRAAHTLAARATDAYEAAREKARRFLNAGSSKEIVFVRGATEGINLVAQSWGRRYIEAGDEILISWAEHHSNIVPWQMLCAEKGAKLRVAPLDDTGQVLLEEYAKLLNSRTKLVSLTHVSNALGTVLPVREMTELAHRFGAKVLIDGAQAVSHMRVDVQNIDADWYVFSGHKVFGPTGIGVVRGKTELFDSAPPWQGGGNMIIDVTFEKTTYHPAPMRLEAGTGNIADAVGLGTALDYVEQIGMENIARWEHELLVYGSEQLRTIPGLRLIGTAREKAGVMGFVIDGLRPEDIGGALAGAGIAVRAGHHCAQPAVRRFGQEATVRPSLALYNTREDIDAMIVVLRQLASNGRLGR